MPIQGAAIVNISHIFKQCNQSAFATFSRLITYYRVIQVIRVMANLVETLQGEYPAGTEHGIRFLDQLNTRTETTAILDARFYVTQFCTKQWRAGDLTMLVANTCLLLDLQSDCFKCCHLDI